VGRDGVERAFTFEPGHPRTLFVEVIDAERGRHVEQTYTRSVRRGNGDWITVHPRGAGWQIHDDSSDHYTVWRRPCPE
jgi:hypothetical protein